MEDGAPAARYVFAVSFRELRTDPDYLDALEDAIAANLDLVRADDASDAPSKYLGSSIRVESDRTGRLNGEAAVRGVAAVTSIYYISIYCAMLSHVLIWTRRRFHDRRRLVAKTVVYRVASVVVTVGIAYLVVGNPADAVNIGVLANAAKMGLYYAHEEVWARSDWGQSYG